MLLHPILGRRLAILIGKIPNIYVAISMTFSANKPWKQRIDQHLASWALSLLVLLAGFATTASLWGYAQQREADNLSAALESSADLAANNIRSRIDTYTVVMNGVKGFFQGSEFVSFQEFHEYVQALQVEKKLSGVQAISLVKLISAEEKAAHIAEIRQTRADYQIKPDGLRPHYAPIIRIEPLGGDNLKALGLDVLTVPAAREAMERARDSGEMAITSRLVLIQDSDKTDTFAFVMYLPIFNSGARTDTPELRRLALIGWVDVPFRMNDLMAGLRGEIDQAIDLEIFDGPVSGQTALFRSVTMTSPTQPINSYPQTLRTLNIGGRQWALRVTATAALRQRVLSRQPEVIALAGAALSLALSVLTWLQARMRRDAQARYRQLFELSGDGVLVMNLHNRIVEANDAALQLLGYQREAILQVSLLDILAPQEHSRLQPAVTQLMQGFDHLEEWLHVRQDGRVLPVEINARRLDEQRFFAILRDLSQRKAAEQRIQRLTLLYKALSETNQAIVRMTDEQALFPLVCRCAVEFGGMKMAWIGQLDALTEHIVPVIVYGDGDSYLDGLVISPRAELAEGRGPTGTAWRENRPVIINDYLAESMTSPWHQRATDFGWGSAATFPIRRNGQAFAVFNVYHAEAQAFDAEAIELLTEMASDVSFALDNFDRETRRRQAETALHQSEAHFRFVTESAQALIWMSGPNKLCYWFNKVWLDFTGRTLEQEIGSGWTQGVHPDDLSRCLDYYNDRFDHRKPFSMEYRLKRHDGKYRWLVDNGAPHYDERGDFQGYIGACLDITERIAAEAGLHAADQRFRAYFERSMVGMATTSADKVWMDVNPALCSMLGYTAEQLTQKTWAELTYAEDLAEDEAQFSRILSGEINEYMLDKRFVRSDGELVYTHLAVRAVRKVDGCLDYLVALVEDISQRKLAEAKIHQQLSELQQWYEVTLDREERVGQLKAEVNHLCNRLGEPPHYANPDVEKSS